MAVEVDILGMAYDIIIRTSGLFDGTGKKFESADIAIQGGTIVGVGNLGKKADAKLVIDAVGKYVTPGFIDITNHSDTRLTIFKYPTQESMIMQGVTTAIGGNCGASLAPLASPFAIQAIQKWSDLSDLNVNWASVKEFLDEVTTYKVGTNFGMFVGFGTLKRGITGDEARALKKDEVEQISYLIEKSIDEGAFGLSFGLSYGHERASQTDELVEIAEAVGRKKGIVKIHLRSEGKELLAAINEAIQIGREAQVSVQVSHLKAIGKRAWPLLGKALEMIENANDSGVRIHFDVSPYRSTGSQLYTLVPAGAREGGFRELFARIDDVAERKKIIEALRALTLHYNSILITSAKMTDVVGKTIGEIAESSGLSNEEALLQVVRSNDGRVTITGHTISMKNIEAAVRHDYSFIASDGAGYGQEEVASGNLVHPRSFGTFPHFLHHFVDDLESLEIERAIQKITSGPAEKIGLAKRGVIKKGNFADIVIFDPNIIKDRATYRDPFRFPAGIEWVIVNGRVSVENGKFLGERAGAVLRKG